MIFVINWKGNKYLAVENCTDDKYLMIICREFKYENKSFWEKIWEFKKVLKSDITFLASLDYFSQ